MRREEGRPHGTPGTGRTGVSVRLAGVVLAGGAARRLGGVDKPMLEVGGIPLLYRAVAALREADPANPAAPVVVVGPRRDGVPTVSWTREDPPGSGPVAALAAGLTVVDAEFVGVLAADLAGVGPATVGRLAEALRTSRADGAVLVDAAGYRQWLIGVWRTHALRQALPDDPRGASLRGTLGSLSIVEVPALAGEADDVDTEQDLHGRELHSRHTGRGVC